MKKLFVLTIALLSISCHAAGPLPKYPSLYTRSNYSSICDSMQVNGDTAGQIVCGWYINDLKRGAEPTGLLYWRGLVAGSINDGARLAKIHSDFRQSAAMEAAGYSIPAR